MRMHSRQSKALPATPPHLDHAAGGWPAVSRCRDRLPSEADRLDHVAHDSIIGHADMSTSRRLGGFTHGPANSGTTREDVLKRKDRP